MIPRDEDWIDIAPVRASASREMEAGPAAVFAVLADHESWPEWFTGIKRVEITGAAEGVGATRRVTARGLGTVDELFVGWEPDRVFAFTLVSAPRRVRSVLRSMSERVTIDDLGADRVRVTYAQGFEPRRGARWLVRLAARTALPKALGKGLAGLEGRS